MVALWRRFKFFIYAMLLAVIVLAGVELDLENNTLASLSVFGWQTPQFTLFRWVSLALLVGFVLGWVFSMVESLGLRLSRHRVKQRLARTEEEVRQLRNMPLHD